MNHPTPEYIIDGISYLATIIVSKKKIPDPTKNNGNEFCNETFCIKAYNWQENKVNFQYKDFQVCWYKHLGRSTYQNKEITGFEWRNILEHCLQSLKQEDKI